jgi:HIV-1 Vpr-binding protein
VRSVSSRVSSGGGKPFALSSSEGETFLWDVSNPEFASDRASVAAFEGACSAAFDERCQYVFHAGGNTPGTASLYDVAAGRDVSRFFAWDENGSENASSRRFVARATSARRFADVDFGPTGSSLVLWGDTLWDVRLPHPVRVFDAFSDGGGACFHPRGDEVVLNSEVWDLRSERLLRSARALDGCKLAWTRTGECCVASYRAPRDESVLASFRKTKHPLCRAFRAVDGERDYAEIATVDADRAVLDVAWNAGADDALLVAECDLASDAGPDAAVRVYEAGRLRPSEEDSDAEDSDAGDGRSEGDAEDDEFFFGDEGAGSGRRRAAGLLDDAALEAMRDDDDDDDERRAARTAAAIAGDGAALAGLRALLGGLVADRIRGAVEAEGAGVAEGEEDDEEEEDEDDVEFSLEPEEDDSAGDDAERSSGSTRSSDSDTESDSVLLSLSSGDGDGDEESVTDSRGEASGEDDESSGGGF